MTLRKTLAVVVLLVLAASALAAQEQTRHLFQRPTLSETHIVFMFANDLWSVPRAGGDAVRLTTGPGVETNPHFSPDGKFIAFTGQYDGNTDVYLLPAAGGVPRRLTYHPATDDVMGWSPDGKRVIFRSGRAPVHFTSRLYSLPVEGGEATVFPLPNAEEGSLSPDESRLAYVPLARAFQSWKRYRGGRATPIWIANLADSAIEKVPRKDSNDFNPLWVGESIYFLSDRNGPVTLFEYNTRTRRVTERIKNSGLDLKAADAGPGAIVYEQFGSIHLFDLKTGQTRPVPIRVAADLPEVRPRWEKVAERTASFDISPTGQRAVFEARGDIFTVPASKGDARNLTASPGAADRGPVWSPDGKTIAYLSDESGEYMLVLRDPLGKGEPKRLSLGAPSFYSNLAWSPDSKRLLFNDATSSLFFIEVETGAITLVESNDSLAGISGTWSPDSKWIAYAQSLPSRMGAIYLYNVETKERRQITDGMSDAASPVFDRSGKYLFFRASTDAGPTRGWIDLSSQGRTMTSSLYLIVLRDDLPSPLAPESDEEKASDTTPKPAAPAAAPAPAAQPAAADQNAPKTPKEGEVRVDFEGLNLRILALPMPARNYVALLAGKAGTLFAVESAGAGQPGFTVHKFDLAGRKADPYLTGIQGLALSANGEKLLYQQGQRFAIASTAAPPAPGSGTISLDGLEMQVDPRAEWRQMYREAFRLQRDFFYDPGYHGVDLKALEAKYAPYLDGLATRDDLNTLFQEVFGELTVGHLYVMGGDRPSPRNVAIGLLGADMAVVNGRYRFTRIFTGESWNPQLRAPLVQPGAMVKEGEYLLEVNGRPVPPNEEVWRFFEGTAGRQTVIKVGPNPDGSGSREITIIPTANEQALRRFAWIEDNRRLVDKLSGGRVAYVYLPDTGGNGWAFFNRYFFPQVDREGAVIDERFNGGGQAADYVIDYLRRPLMNYWSGRYGRPLRTPYASILGPKVMVINEYAGSGGDAMPWYFRRAGIGPLVGKRTWGGLVGIGGVPSLLDGGVVTAPNFAFWTPEGKWEVENYGVDPDVEVEFDPQLWRQGRDPQLEKAVQIVLDGLKKNPLPTHKKPDYPNYQKRQ